MIGSIGDFAVSEVIDFKFTTVNEVGGPTTLAGSPAVAAYKDNSTTESTSGITLTVDFDGRTGLHHVRVDTSSDGTFYSAGSLFDLVVTAGTVAGESIGGYVVGRFSLEKGAALRPTVPGRTLDVTAAGDVARVDGHTPQSGDNFARLGAPTGASIAADVQTRSSHSAAAVWAVGDRTLTALGASLVQEIWDRATSALTTVGSIGKLLVDMLDAAVGSRAPESGGNLAAVKAQTDRIIFDGDDHVAADVRKINASAAAATGIQQNAETIAVDGAVDAGAAQTTFEDPVDGSVSVTAVPVKALVPTFVTDFQFRGKPIHFARATTTTALRGQSSLVRGGDFAATPPLLYVDPLTDLPVEDDAFTIS